SDGNGSHASTLKSPLYTKSVSWQHYQESGKKMNALKRLFDISPEKIDSLVRFGNVRDEIIRLSKEGEYDAIVIGSKNPGITTHLLGSNAESILRYATIPVLVVR
ncbi:universal stress protein, partial [Enterobacter roggenkampii]|uniref:universal stress protein n=1 Tax=Enterobacter roggenkampii TaxID=1812935 RepID=UPI0035AB9E3E